MTAFLDPLLSGLAANLRLRNARTGTLIAGHVEAALDSASRNRGLLGRDGLPPGHALVLGPSNAIHTFFMRFPIDVLFVARDGRIVKLYRSLGAWRVAFALGATLTVELPAGTIDATGTERGDHLAFEVAGSPDGAAR